MPEEVKAKVESCLNGVFNGKLSGVLDGSVSITKSQGEKIGSCFENAVKELLSGKGAPGGEGFGPGAGVKGGKAPSMDEIRKQIPANVDKIVW